MKKIQVQNITSCDSYDFRVQYNSNGTATLEYFFGNAGAPVVNGSVPLTKEFTDTWVNDQQLVDLIQERHPGINLTEITE